MTRSVFFSCIILFGVYAVCQGKENRVYFCKDLANGTKEKCKASKEKMIYYRVIKGHFIRYQGLGSIPFTNVRTHLQACINRPGCYSFETRKGENCFFNKFFSVLTKNILETLHLLQCCSSCMFFYFYLCVYLMSVIKDDFKGFIDLFSEIKIEKKQKDKEKFFCNKREGICNYKLVNMLTFILIGLLKLNP